MDRNLRSIWLVVTLAVRADPWRALLVALMELANGLCVATYPLWLKLLADAAVERDMTLALVAAACGAGAVTVGLFAGWLGANGQTVLRERTGLALEERLARLSLGVPGLEHHERPDYRDTLALLREERGRLGDSFYAIISGLQLGGALRSDRRPADHGPLRLGALAFVRARSHGDQKEGRAAPPVGDGGNGRAVANGEPPR